MSRPAGDAVSRSVTSLRVIAFALALGIVLFLVVAAVVAPIGGEAMQRQGGVLTLVATILAAAHAGGFVLIHRSIVQRAGRVLRDAEPPVARAAAVQAYQVDTIVACALAEGAALVGIVFYVLSGSVGLTVFPVLGLLAIAMRFPSLDRYESFVGDLGIR